MICVTTAVIATQQRIQKENRQKRIQQQVKQQLLLQGETEPMEIKASEKIITGKVYNNWKDWSIKIDDENEFIEPSLAKIFARIVKTYNPKAFQLIPNSVEGNYVNSYLLILKVDDPEFISIEKGCKKMAEELTEKLKNEW